MFIGNNMMIMYQKRRRHIIQENIRIVSGGNECNKDMINEKNNYPKLH